MEGSLGQCRPRDQVKEEPKDVWIPSHIRLSSGDVTYPHAQCSGKDFVTLLPVYTQVHRRHLRRPRYSACTSVVLA